MKIRILAWDIETSPNLGWVWSIWNQNITLNMIEQFTEVMCFAARWVDDPVDQIIFKSAILDGKEVMLEEAWRLINEADALLSWNGAGFDSKHMKREFLLAEMGPPSPWVELDLMKVAKKQFRFTSNKLEHVSRQLGLAGKVQHSGFDLWRRCMEGDAEAWAEMREYNEQDVHLLVDLYERFLPWIGNHPNQNLFVGDDGLCPRCGEDKLTRQGTRPFGQLGIYQRFRCTGCGGWSRSGKAMERVDMRSI